jgi:hypothetical protein
MFEATPRRAFLRQLCALPLIGGGLSIIGAPTAIAEPVTEALFERYASWVAREHAECMVERTRRSYATAQFVEEYAADTREIFMRRWLQGNMAFSDAAHDHPPGLPSSRAALVLSAVGCDWRQREGGR